MILCVNIDSLIDTLFDWSNIFLKTILNSIDNINDTADGFKSIEDVRMKKNNQMSTKIDKPSGRNCFRHVCVNRRSGYYITCKVKSKFTWSIKPKL